MTLEILRVERLELADFLEVLHASGLAERRPVSDTARLERMLANSNLIVVARRTDDGRIVGVARSVTDFAYCCYLSDLAVDQAVQGQGLGGRLIDKTRELAGPGAACLLLSAPDAVGFYETIGMVRPDNAFLYRREC